MANRPHLLNVSAIAAARDGVYNDGGALPGCALEIHVRSGGKSKRAYFRYNGTPFGEKRTERLPLGSYDLGLPRLRSERVVCEQLIEQSKSPKRHLSDKKDRQRAEAMTLRDALEEFWAHASERLWSPNVRVHNDQVRKKHLDPMKIMDLPLASIRAQHLDEEFGHKWRTMGGTGKEIRSLLHGTFQCQMDKDDGIYRGPNPASWRKTSSLSRRLGPSPPSKPHPGPHYEDVPKIVAFFCAPMDHWVPGYLTTMQAAYALNRDPKSIRTANDQDLFPGVREAPRIWKCSSNLFPIDELKKVFGEFVREPVPHEQESARMHSRLARFVLFTPVRASNACELRWRNIKEHKGLIEYLPKRISPTGEWLPSEHKLGWKKPVPYLVVYTDNLRALIEEQREQQIRDGIKIEPDGFVFVHSRSHSGGDRWFGKRSSHRTLDDYFTKAVDRLNAQKANIRLVPEDGKKVTVHGMRATFTTWAKEQDYSDDLINLSLGHVIPAIRENKTNWHYFYEVMMKLTPRRIDMMAHWEQHCLSLCTKRRLRLVASKIIDVK
jgi:integrase